MGRRHQAAVPQRRRPRQPRQHLRHGARQELPSKAVPEADGVPGVRGGAEDLRLRQQRKYQSTPRSSRPRSSRAGARSSPTRCRSNIAKYRKRASEDSSTRSTSTRAPAPESRCQTRRVPAASARASWARPLTARVKRRRILADGARRPVDEIDDGGAEGLLKGGFGGSRVAPLRRSGREEDARIGDPRPNRRGPWPRAISAVGGEPSESWNLRTSMRSWTSPVTPSSGRLTAATAPASSKARMIFTWTSLDSVSLHCASGSAAPPAGVTLWTLSLSRAASTEGSGTTSCAPDAFRSALGIGGSARS